MTVLVASDLDQTLIYPLPGVQHSPGGTDEPRKRCVELYEGRPVSFMTETAAELLVRLATNHVFVPATTRTREQFQRLTLPGPAPQYAVCSNGGHILVNGVPDHHWRQSMAARIANECAPITEVSAHLRASAPPALPANQRNAEDLFVYLILGRAEVPHEWTEELTAWAAERGWSISHQGSKVYAVPKPLTKSAAVREVGRRIGSGTTLAAGDSLLDIDLLLAADHAWRPGHGELARAHWSAPHLTALTESGPTAGEEIIRQFASSADAHTLITTRYAP